MNAPFQPTLLTEPTSILATAMSAHSGVAPLCLLDVVRTNGDSFHWANAKLTAPSIYGGNVPAWAATLVSPPASWDTFYFPWLLNASGIHLYRSQQADVANFLVQNISGNSLQRDVAGQLLAASFEGALFAFRVWPQKAQTPEFEMHGRLTVSMAGEQTCQFATTPLYDTSTTDGNPYEVSETCQWNYGEPGCGDTTANPCANSYPTCRQSARFFGVLNTFQVNLAPTLTQINTQAVNRARMV
jgi:hypothetical protein